jgi:hypothetical protein
VENQQQKQDVSNTGEHSEKVQQLQPYFWNGLQQPYQSDQTRRPHLKSRFVWGVEKNISCFYQPHV